MHTTTISVPITQEQKRFIKERVKSGKAANVAHAVRQAITLLEEEDAVVSLLRAQQEAREGKVFSGDLAELAKKFSQ